VEEESKPKTEACPMLYDLTSLQREANGRFGFSAKNTLG
jgi:DNA topoisomerase-3